jgi:hypothetical protein
MTVTAKSTWPAIARLFDARSAHAMSVLLRAAGISAAITPAAPGAVATPMWQVQVSPEQLDIAMVLFEESRLTDAELNYLASGLTDGEGGA